MADEYPYEEQEAQLLAQMAARRKAYMQRYGQAETQYTSPTQPLSKPRSLIVENLFSGDIFK
jgi:hypothetical protein